MGFESPDDRQKRKEDIKTMTKGNEELIDDVKKEYERIQPKTEAEFFSKAKGIPSNVYLKKRFKTSWWGLKKLIGHNEGNSYSRKSREEYIEIMKNLGKRLGRTPTQNDFRNSTGMSIFPIYRIFGGFVNALQEAGFIARSPDCVKETKDELIEQYRKLLMRLGKQASAKDLNLYNDIHGVGVYYLRFGTMTELKEKAGFVPNYSSRNKYTKKAIMELLIGEYLKGNKPLPNKELELNKDFPSRQTILKYFKSTGMKSVWKEVQQVIEEKRMEEYQNDEIN